MSLMKTLKMKRIEPGLYRGRPYWGTTAEIRKARGVTRFTWYLLIEQKDDGGNVIGLINGVFRTIENALLRIELFGHKKVKTTNILNPEAGEFDIELSLKGGCCDPATERYHCM